MPRLPPRGPLGSRSPASPVLSGHYDFLPPVPPHFVAFARAVPRERSAVFVSPAATERQATGLGLFDRYPRPVFLPWRRQDLPSSWGTPIPVCTCSQTPVGRFATDQNTAAAWPPLEERRRLRQYQTFEAQWHGFQVRCLRFAVPVTRPHARLASRCWSGSPGQAFHPQGSDDRFQTHVMLVIPLSQACLAQSSPLVPGGGVTPKRVAMSTAASRSGRPVWRAHRSSTLPWA